METRYRRPTWGCVEDSQDSFSSCSREVGAGQTKSWDFAAMRAGLSGEKSLFAGTKVSVFITAGNRQHPDESEDFSSKADETR